MTDKIEPMSDEELAEVREFMSLPAFGGPTFSRTLTDARVFRLIARLDAAEDKVRVLAESEMHLQAQRDVLQAVVDKLHKWIDNYGTHSPDCPSNTREPADCVCGMSALITELAETEQPQQPQRNHIPEAGKKV